MNGRTFATRISSKILEEKTRSSRYQIRSTMHKSTNAWRIVSEDPTKVVDSFWFPADFPILGFFRTPLGPRLLRPGPNWTWVAFLEMGREEEGWKVAHLWRGQFFLSRLLFSKELHRRKNRRKKVVEKGEGEQLKMVAEWTKGSKGFPAYSQVYRRHFQVKKLPSRITSAHQRPIVERTASRPIVKMTPPLL